MKQELIDLKELLEKEGFLPTFNEKNKLLLVFNDNKIEIGYAEGEWVYYIHLNGNELDNYQEFPENVVKNIKLIYEKK